MTLWAQGKRLSRAITRVCCSRYLSEVKGSVSYHATPICQAPTSDENSNVVLGVTCDGKAVVCFHHATNVAFELTKAIPRLDPINDPAETHDLVLKSKLSGEIMKNKLNPTIEELSKMFYTTKHRWYPVGQYHTRRRNRNSPRD